MLKRAKADIASADVGLEYDGLLYRAGDVVEVWIEDDQYVARGADGTFVVPDKLLGPLVPDTDFNVSELDLALKIAGLMLEVGELAFEIDYIYDQVVALKEKAWLAAEADILALSGGTESERKVRAQRLMEQTEAGKFMAILNHDKSALGREVRLREQLIEALDIVLKGKRDRRDAILRLQGNNIAAAENGLERFIRTTLG